SLDNVTISDVSGVATGANAPRIYYKKSSGSTWFSKSGTLTSGTTFNGTWSFVITAADMGTVATGDNIQYYVIAQDVAPTPNISSNPTGASATNVNTVTTPPTPNSYVVSSNFSGTFTVGTGGNYATLTAAVNAYNNGCLNGPVTFTLISPTYNAETLPIVISNPLASATNTLTIKPGTGVTPTITGAPTVAMIQLKGADYITIDGSNTAGGTTKDLTISSTSGSVVPVIWITSGSSTDGASNNIIKNIKFTGNTPTTTAGGIIAGGNVLGGDAEAPNNSNTIQNNQFNRFQNAIFIRGNATTPDANWNITGNTIGSATPSEKMGFRGMLIGNMQNATISNNTITGVVVGPTSNFTPTGIIVVGNMNGGLIYNNRISDIKNPNTAGYGSNGIQLSATSTASNLTIYNNFIWDIASYGFAGIDIADNAYGMIVTSGGGYNIYHNTINMNTNQTLAGGLPAAFNVMADVTTPGAINLRDNIFVNSQTAGNTERFTIISDAPNTVFSQINYNDYYSTGPNLGFIGSTRNNLAAIQAGFGGNANSVSIQPIFVSSSDLHLDQTTNGTLDNKGTSVGVTTDIDGITRSTTTPDIGADEFTGANCTPPSISTQPTAQSVCVSNPVTFTVAATGTSLTYQWRKGTTNIAGATNTTYTINSVVAGDAASYSVLVNSACGSVTSNAVALTVNTCTAIVPVDEDISSAVLLPNVVHDGTLLRVTAHKSTRVEWIIADVQGRVVMKFSQKLLSGVNDIELQLSRLAGGVYYLTGNTTKGRTSVVPLYRK
ncbi:MAG: beta strand repeat-containing protein, partial [Flavisolibacter sp.]